MNINTHIYAKKKKGVSLCSLFIFVVTSTIWLKFYNHLICHTSGGWSKSEGQKYFKKKERKYLINFFKHKPNSLLNYHLGFTVTGSLPCTNSIWLLFDQMPVNSLTSSCLRLSNFLTRVLKESQASSLKEWRVYEFRRKS